MELRNATAEDLDHILALEEETFPETAFSRATFLYYLGSRSSRVRVLEHDDILSGYVVYTLQNEPPVAYIDSIAVQATYRGRGLGRAMMEHVRRAALEQGAERVKLHVRASNQAAQAFYRALGFRRTGSVSSYYRDGENALVMELDLAQ